MEVTLRDYSAVIRLFAQSESPEKAMRVLEEMEARGLKPDNVSSAARSGYSGTGRSYSSAT